MNHLTRISFLCFAIVPLSWGASKEMIQLQRDVSLMQDELRVLQRSQDEKISGIQVLLQQTLDSVGRTNSNVSTLASQLQTTLRDQQSSVSAPVAGLGNKLDQMSEDFRAVRESVLDMNSRIGKIEAKLVDIQNMASISRSALPPPGSSPAPNMPQGSAPSTPAGSSSAAPPAGMQAETTYSNAYRDYSGGNLDLAMQEFQDYVKYFGSTQFAPNAQFYIGDIFYRKNDYENAVTAFDQVMERFSENSKTADAHYMKGLSLLKLNKRDAAAREFKEVNSRYPNTDVAPKAQQELKRLGLSAGPAPARRR